MAAVILKVPLMRFIIILVYISITYSLPVVEEIDYSDYCESSEELQNNNFNSFTADQPQRGSSFGSSSSSGGSSFSFGSPSSAGSSFNSGSSLRSGPSFRSRPSFGSGPSSSFSSDSQFDFHYKPGNQDFNSRFNSKHDSDSDSYSHSSLTSNVPSSKDSFQYGSSPHSNSEIKPEYDYCDDFGSSSSSRSQFGPGFQSDFGSYSDFRSQSSSGFQSDFGSYSGSSPQSGSGFHPDLGSYANSRPQSTTGFPYNLGSKTQPDSRINLDLGSYSNSKSQSRFPSIPESSSNFRPQSTSIFNSNSHRQSGSEPSQFQSMSGFQSEDVSYFDSSAMSDLGSFSGSSGPIPQSDCIAEYENDPIIPVIDTSSKDICWIQDNVKYCIKNVDDPDSFFSTSTTKTVQSTPYPDYTILYCEGEGRRICVISVRDPDTFFQTTRKPGMMASGEWNDDMCEDEEDDVSYMSAPSQEIIQDEECEEDPHGVLEEFPEEDEKPTPTEQDRCDSMKLIQNWYYVILTKDNNYKTQLSRDEESTYEWNTRNS